MTTSEDNIFNNEADFWNKVIGANPLPANTKNKIIIVPWKELQDKPVSDNKLDEWKQKGLFNDGIAVMTGPIHDGPYAGKYLIGIDCDSKLALKEILIRDGQTITLQQLADLTRVEQHRDNPNKAHIYILSTKPFENKPKDPKFPELGIEIKCDHLTMFTAPSIHQDGHSYEVLGVKEPILFDQFESHLKNIFKKYDIEYPKQKQNIGNGNYYTSNLPEELRQLANLRELVIPNNLLKYIKNGSRHPTLVSLTNTILFANRRLNGNGHHKDKLENFVYQINNQVCEEPLPRTEIQQIWKDCNNFVADHPTNDTTTNNENENDPNQFASKSKASVYKQLSDTVKQQLSEFTCWTHTSISPLKFIIAHKEFKQIINASVKSYEVPKPGGKDGEFETKYYLNLSDIIFDAIPLKVTKHIDLLGLSSENYHKYTIEFVTKNNKHLKIGPKFLDEIILYLKNNMLIPTPKKAPESLSAIISAFEDDDKITEIKDIETPGFYYINGKITGYHIDHPKPVFEEISKCCELLDTLQNEFKKKDVLPTIIKWSIMAPFDFVIKQIHKKWIPWPYPYGWSNTGKSTLGDMACCVWNRYDDKDAIIPYTAADTVARLGESLSKSTYLVVINEVSQLSDDFRKRDVVEMAKTAITDIIGRKKFAPNKTNWTAIPSLSACILTGNSTPPKDTGFRRRIIPIVFTEKDQYSKDEMLKFQKLFDERIKKEFRYLGDFTANYILEHPEIIIDGVKDWKEIAQTILTEFYKAANKEAPEWINNFVELTQLEDSKEDVGLLFRSFLVNKINETYNKFYGNTDSVEFETRLSTCLYNNFIPFLNPIKIKDKEYLIAITSDILSELKPKIPEISSLPEIASIVNGFEYGQKRIGGRNTKTAHGTINQLLMFLGVKSE